MLSPLIRNSRFLLNIVSYTLLFSAVTGISLVAPRVWDRVIAAKIRPSVVKITLLDSRDKGGTGFGLKTDKGSFIVTNAHICRALQEGLGMVFIENDPEPKLSRVLRISETADLCLMSPVEGLPTLSLADVPDIQDEVATFGHPLLNPQTISRGFIIAKNIGSVADECDSGVKYGKSLITHPLYGCMRIYNVYMTTIVAYPGNSGSPVVNIYGNVVGVLFATNRMTNQALIVIYSDLKTFLEE